MGSSTEIKIYHSPEEVMEKAAADIGSLLAKKGNSAFHMVLAGGETPKKLYRILNEKYRDLISSEHIHFWWGDERCVPPDHPESNYNLVNETLFKGLNIKQENIHRMKGEADPEREAERYADEITSYTENEKDLVAFDLIILGMGNDGHTASIFPDRTDLLNHDPLCAVTQHPDSGQKRITLTGKILNEGKNLFFIVTGKSKAEPVAKIMNNEESASLLPAFHISSRYGKTIWYMDEAAASGME